MMVDDGVERGEGEEGEKKFTLADDGGKDVFQVERFQRGRKGRAERGVHVGN